MPPSVLGDELHSLKVTLLINAFLCQTAMPLRDKGQEGHDLTINVSKTSRVQSPHWQLPHRSLLSKDAYLFGPLKS